MQYLSWLGVLVLAQSPSLSEPFKRLQQTLTQHGFQVLLTQPPRWGSYGLFQPSSKTIWINPVVVDLGIAEPTLVHEAVHAVQSCAGQGPLRLLNLGFEAPNPARPYILEYHPPARALEAQAFAVQTRPDGVEQAIALVQHYCPKPSKLPQNSVNP